MRIVAILAVRNEERFIQACIEHHVAQGVEIYLIDQESTDHTLERAGAYRGRGLIGVETLSHEGVFLWRRILERKEELALSLDADWFIHLDADEFFLPPPGFSSLREALADVDSKGFNAANAMEFTFVPVRESPGHDHARFRETMRWYYPFEPQRPHRLCTWKKQADRVDLAGSGGHRVAFPGLRMSPLDFRMKHYMFLSPGHASEKYGHRKYDEAEVSAGWHTWRAELNKGKIRLPSSSELRTWQDDDKLDASHPRQRHVVDR